MFFKQQWVLSDHLFKFRIKQFFHYTDFFFKFQIFRFEPVFILKKRKNHNIQANASKKTWLGIL